MSILQEKQQEEELKSTIRKHGSQIFAKPEYTAELMKVLAEMTGSCVLPRIVTEYYCKDKQIYNASRLNPDCKDLQKINHLSTGSDS
jgi:hypothetical protein